MLVKYNGMYELVDGQRLNRETPYSICKGM